MRDSYILYQDKLNGEYQKTFEQIAVYFAAQQVDDDTREEYMGDLLDIFLLAQEEGRSVEKITGKNLESFCKSFCSNLTWQQKALRMLDQLKSYAWVVFLCSFIEICACLERIISGEIRFFEVVAETNMFGYLLGTGIVFVISAITGYMTKMFMFRMKKVSMQIWKMIVAVMVIASAFIFIVLYFDEQVVELSVGVVWLISGIYLVLYYIFNRERLSARKEHKVSFWAEVKKGADSVDTDQIVAEAMEKKWEKKNKKLLKKGKVVMTREEVLLAEEAECFKDENFKVWHYMLPLIISMVICVVISVWLGMPFEEIADVLWFWGGLLVVEYVFLILLRKTTHSGLVNRRKWIETERKKLENVDVEMYD